MFLYIDIDASSHYLSAICLKVPILRSTSFRIQREKRRRSEMCVRYGHCLEKLYWKCVKFICLYILLCICFYLFFKKFYGSSSSANDVSKAQSVCLICVSVKSTPFHLVFLKKEVQGIVHPKMKICLKCTQSQAIQYVDEFVSSSEEIWRNFASYHLLTNESSAVNGCRQ